jgi:hypothetical protein
LYIATEVAAGRIAPDLYQISLIETRLGFSNQRRFDSRWRTQEVRHADPASGRF